MEILKAGMYIAQGAQTNVLLLLGGEAPMLKVLGAIDLNHFNQTGKARELDENSPEIVDILTYPDSYTFALPSITEAINATGFSGNSFGEVKEFDEKEKNKMVENGYTYYKSVLCYGIDQAKVKTRLYLKRTYNISMSQANYIFTLIAKLCNRPIV